MTRERQAMELRCPTTRGVDFSQADGVATIRLNRPDVLNAVDLEAAYALRSAVVAAERSQTARCILLTGAGKHFSAGGDVRFFHGTLDLPLAERQGVFDEILQVLNDAIPRLRQMPKPVVVSARGAVAGLGVSLVAACDIAIAASDAVFSMAYCAIGGVPDSGASAAIAKLSNRKRAAELLLLGERFDAKEAKDLGLIGRIVEPDALDATTAALCDKLAAGPTWALGRAKRLLRSAETTPLETQLAHERSAFVECVATADFAEGLKAFVDRRRAVFVGA
jgi:2-(1,2-epoxy-1,2-dihydrophenyl)acetyl-CoA isomerase